MEAPMKRILTPGRILPFLLVLVWLSTETTANSQTRTGPLKNYIVNPSELFRGKEYDISVTSPDCTPDELRGAELIAPYNTGIEVLRVNNTNPCILIARISVSQDAFLRHAMLWVNKDQIVMGTINITVADSITPGITPAPSNAGPTKATSATRPRSVSETPAVELFGGYSYARIDFTEIGHFNGHGFDASVAANINKYFGIEGDFSRHYSTLLSATFLGSDVDAKLQTYTVMGGPRFTARSNAATIYGHALFGFAHVRGEITALGFSLSTSQNGFAAAFGGGVDVNIHRRVAIRAVQAEYLLTRIRGVFDEPRTQNNLRLSAGIVIRLGSR
jgi:opacity protein-like surface antigen